MVDESDIDNYFKKESKELKDLLGATPDRYLHFKRTTDPLTDDDRAEAEKLISELNEARLAGASKDEQKAIEKKIQSFTFRPQYEIQLDTSELVSRSYSEEQVQEVLESIGKGKPKDDESGDSRDKTKDDDESGDSQEKTEDKRGPQYDLYVKRKKQKNEKPLDQERGRPV